MRTLFTIGGTLLVILALLVGVGYVFIYQPYVAPYYEAFQQAGELADFDERVTHQSEYTPPEDGVLTSDQVERYMRVQAEVEREMSHQIEALEHQANQLRDRVQNDRSVRETAHLIREAVDGLVVAKEVQVDALNRQDFSLEEYRWVQQEIYRAMDYPLLNKNLSEMMQEARWGNIDGEALDAPAQDQRDVPEQNRELVRGYTDRLEEKAAFAILGL